MQKGRAEEDVYDANKRSRHKTGRWKTISGQQPHQKTTGLLTLWRINLHTHRCIDIAGACTSVQHLQPNRRLEHLPKTPGEICKTMAGASEPIAPRSGDTRVLNAIFTSQFHTTGGEDLEDGSAEDGSGSGMRSTYQLRVFLIWETVVDVF